MTEIAASIQNITPACRDGRGTTGAIDEALARIRAAYIDCAAAPDNVVTWRISLVRIEAQP